MPAENIRFTRDDYNKLCRDDFYSQKDHTRYAIYNELTNKKVGYWDSSKDLFYYNNKNKSIVDWLTINSFIKGTLKESESSVAITNYTRPKTVLEIEEIVKGINKDIQLVTTRYTDGNPRYDMIFQQDIDEALQRDNMFGRTMILSRLKEFTTEIYNELVDKYNVLTVNLASYQVYKSPSKVQFCVTIILSYTKVIVNK